MRISRTLAALAAGVLVVTACTGSDAPDSDDGSPTDDPADTDPADDRDEDASGDEVDEGAAGRAPDGLDWRACDDAAAIAGPELECATLLVPLDHEQPDGETIEIAVARADTAGGDQLGHVVFNPGGPGGSGIDFLTQAALTIPTDVQDRFDLVSFDPRGVGASTAVECDIEIDDNVTILEAGDDAVWQALVEEATALDTVCTPETLELAPYVGTNNAARDLELLRDALGDDGLTYVGYSYGTRLGATYAELFPERVRALVLDAAVLPNAELAELGRGQAEGFDRALTNFAAACDADEDCLLQELGPTLDVIEGLRGELDEVGELPAGSGRVLTRGEFDLGIVAALYSKDAWPFLAQGLYVAETQQDGELLQVLGDNLQGRQPDGSYDNSNVANGFINCADDPTRPAVDEVRAGADDTAALSTWFDDVLRASTGCLGVAESIDPLAIGPAAGAAPILVIGSTGDPATPYEWSVELADQLESGVLYTVEAEGHTAFGSIDCVAEPVAAYLVDLAVPEMLECSDNAEADFFVPVADDEFAIIVRLFDCLRESGADIPEVTVADLLADPTGETIGEYLDPTDPAIAAGFEACADIVEDLQAAL
ncbi:MAG: alpha/beta fold hydrolase [Actinomycetota bacterium]